MTSDEFLKIALKVRDEAVAEADFHGMEVLVVVVKKSGQFRTCRSRGLDANASVGLLSRALADAIKTGP